LPDFFLDFSIEKFHWINEPKDRAVSDAKVKIVTEPDTDLWSRTYYNFRRTTAHMLVMETEIQFFSFSVKADRRGTVLFDQCGVVIYQDEENWFKGSMEYENYRFQNLGSVVTNNGYSDFGTSAIDPRITAMYYRLNRRQSDFLLECSPDGSDYTPLRLFHLFRGAGIIHFGIYACSPSNTSCTAEFTEMSLDECQWPAWK
jgi:regulation of enolase protein 1 (concanavalin A-like superfamily)